MGRGLTPEQLLQAWFNTKFVTRCKNSRKLARSLETVKETAVWPDHAVLAERFRVVLTAKEAETRDQESEVIANAAIVARQGSKAAAEDDQSGDDLIAMAGKFRRGNAGGRGQPSKTVVCNNCLGNHLMSMCPKPLSTCSSCGERHITARCEAVKEQAQKRKERDEAYARR